LEVFNLSKALDKTDGNLDLISELVRMLHEEGLGYIDTLRRDLENGQAKAVARTALSIKCLAYYLGGDSLYQSALAMETLGMANELGPGAEALSGLETAIKRLAEATLHI